MKSWSIHLSQFRNYGDAAGPGPGWNCARANAELQPKPAMVFRTRLRKEPCAFVYLPCDLG